MGGGRVSSSPRLLHQADDVALRVGEKGDGRLRRDLGQRHQHLAAELLDLVERGLRVLGVDVEGDPTLRTRLGVPDAAGDAVALAAHHAVAAGVVRVELPAESVRIELLGLLPVLARYLEMNDVATHDKPPLHLAASTRATNGMRQNRQMATAIFGDALLDPATGALVRNAGVVVERGYFAGPRMRLAIQILSETGGHADSMFPCGVPVPLVNSPDIPPSVVDGVEPMRLRVRELIRAGADWIKLCTSGGVLSPGDAPHHPAFTIEEIRAAVEEAAAHGRQVMAHAQANASIKNALRAGVRTIEHGIWLDDDAIEMMLDGKHTLVPTLVAQEWVVRHANEGRMPAWAAEKGRAVIADHKASVRKAIEAGVRIAFGTDTGVGPHGTMGEEFLLMNQLGMGPGGCPRPAPSVAAWGGRLR